MKIVSSFLDDLHLKVGGYHSLNFESTYLLKLFKHHLNAYFNKQKQSDTMFMTILDDNNKELKPKELYFVNFNCHHINLEADKEIKKQIQEILIYQLENNPILLEKFTSFHEHLITFTDELELDNEQLSVQFHSTDKTIMKLIQALEIEVEYENDEYVPNYKLREFIISFLLSMNNDRKTTVLLVSYPEADVGRNEFHEVINSLQGLNITVLVLSSQKEFLTSAEDQQMFLVNKMGTTYDIITLRKELIKFNIISENSDNELVRSIALKDFNADYQLMDHDIKSFLMSNKC